MRHLPATGTSLALRVACPILLGTCLAALGACDDSPPRPTATTQRPPAAASATPAATSVADHFSPPQPHPGPAWTRQGRPTKPGEINSVAGPRHCDWHSAVILHLGWPPGTAAQTSASVRQYIRDPRGVIDFAVRDKLATGVDLPRDARDTGYRSGDLQLWLAPSDPDAAYLRAGDDVERWPRAQPVVACR